MPGFADYDTKTLWQVRSNLAAGLDKVAAHLDAGTFHDVGDKGKAPPGRSPAKSPWRSSSRSTPNSPRGRRRVVQLDEAGERANTLVSNWIVRGYRKNGGNQHLRGCDQAVVEVAGGDSTYGCDTGCDYLRLDAVLTCPHGERDEYEYGDFTELAFIIEDLERGDL